MSSIEQSVTPKVITQMGYDDGISVLEKLAKTDSNRLRSFNTQLTNYRNSPADLRVAKDQNGDPQPHATTRYNLLDLDDWFNALRDIIAAKDMGAKKLNFHLPDEIEFESRRDLPKGERFMDYVDSIGSLIGVRTIWENSYLVNKTDWSCVENQSYIPNNRILCLDTGHLILLSQNRDEALSRIDNFLDLHGDRVSHLHLHINDLVRDLHWCDPDTVKTFLGSERFKRLTIGRTYIFEEFS